MITGAFYALQWLYRIQTWKEPPSRKWIYPPSLRDSDEGVEQEVNDTRHCESAKQSRCQSDSGLLRKLAMTRQRFPSLRALRRHCEPAKQSRCQSDSGLLRKLAMTKFVSCHCEPAKQSRCTSGFRIASQARNDVKQFFYNSFIIWLCLIACFIRTVNFAFINRWFNLI